MVCTSPAANSSDFVKYVGLESPALPLEVLTVT